MPLGMTAWVGWLVATWQVLRALTPSKGVAQARPHILPVVWVGGMFLWQGMQYVYSMRYLLPLYPALGLLAAWFLWWLVERARGCRFKVAWMQGGRNLQPSTFQPSSPAVPQRMGCWLRSPSARCFGVGVSGDLPPTADAYYGFPVDLCQHSGRQLVAIEDWDEGLPLGIDGRTGYGRRRYYGLQSTDRGQCRWPGRTHRRSANAFTSGSTRPITDRLEQSAVGIGAADA